MKFLLVALCYVSVVAVVSAQRGPPGAQRVQVSGIDVKTSKLFSVIEMWHSVFIASICGSTKSR